MRALLLIALFAATPLFAEPAPAAPDPPAPAPRPFVDRGWGKADALAGFLCTGDSQPLDPHITSTAQTSSFGRQGDFVGAALHLRF